MSRQVPNSSSFSLLTPPLAPLYSLFWLQPSLPSFLLTQMDILQNAGVTPLGNLGSEGGGGGGAAAAGAFPPNPNVLGGPAGLGGEGGGSSRRGCEGIGSRWGGSGSRRKARGWDVRRSGRRKGAEGEGGVVSLGLIQSFRTVRV